MLSYCVGDIMHTEKMMNYVKTAGADALLLLDEANMHYVDRKSVV